jgi:hypothetical protein
MRILGKLVPFFVLATTAGCPYDDPQPAECDTIVADYEAELAAVQSCTDHAECGQPIPGTSCGCTRDLVARTDADLTVVGELQAQAAEEACDIGGTSVCDCPEALGFGCFDGACAFNHVDRYPYLPACPQEGALVQIDAVELVGDALSVTLQYSGGCQEHHFALCWNDQALQETTPPTAALTLFHEDNDDECDGWFTETVQLSVAALQQAYADQYGGTGTITLTLDGTSVDYTF